MYGNKVANGLEYEAPMFSRCFVCKAKNYRTCLKGHLLFGTISCMDCEWYADTCSNMADRMGTSPTSKSCKHVNVKWNYEAFYNVMKTMDPTYMSEYLRQYLRITFRMRKFKPWCEAYFLFQESMKSLQDNKDFCKREIVKSRKVSDSSSSAPSKEENEEIGIDLLDSDISTCDDDLDNYLVNTQNFTSKEKRFTPDTVKNNCPVKTENYTLNQKDTHMLHIDKNHENPDQLKINATKRVLYAGSKPVKVGNCSKENTSNDISPTGDESNHIDLTNCESDVKEEPSSDYDDVVLLDSAKFMDVKREKISMLPSNVRSNCISIDFLSDFCLLCGYQLSAEKMVYNTKLGCIIFFCSNCSKNLIYFVNS